MADFDAVIEAQLAGAVVRCSPLVEFDFVSGAKRVWPGFGPVIAGGKTWEGVRGLGTMSPITSGVGGAVEEMTFSLFGDTQLLGHLSEDAEESDGREVNVWLQFFDLRQRNEAGEWVEWETLSDPLAMFWGRMGPLRVTMSEPNGEGRRGRIVSVSAQSAFINRARPPFQFFSDRDQKARTDGEDNIFVRVPDYVEGTVRWPQF